MPPPIPRTSRRAILTGVPLTTAFALSQSRTNDTPPSASFAQFQQRVAEQARVLLAPGTVDQASAAFTAIQAVVCDYMEEALGADAYPALRLQEIEAGLATLLAPVGFVGDSEPGQSERSSVFGPRWERAGDPESRSVFAAVYGLRAAFHGKGATRICVESYVSGGGEAPRRIARGGGEMSGRIPRFGEAFGEIHGTAIHVLVSGPMTGWSGRNYGSPAVLYRAGFDGVETVWQMPIRPALRSYPHERHFDIVYAHPERFDMFPEAAEPWLLESFTLHNDQLVRIARSSF